MVIIAPFFSRLRSAMGLTERGVFSRWLSGRRASALLTLLIFAAASAVAGDAVSPVTGSAALPVVTPPAFPAFIGDHDRERLLVTLSNPGNTALALAVSFGGDAPQPYTIALAARETKVATIELHVGTGQAQTVRSLEIRDERGSVVYQRRLVCIAPDGDFAGLRWNGHGFVNGTGDPAVLIAPSLDGSQQRRWGLLRSIEGNPLALGNRVVLWTNPWSPSAALAELTKRIGAESSGKTVTTLPYAGNPAAASLDAATAIAGAEPATICLAWGNEEAYLRRPVKDLLYGLIVAARRIQRANPQHHVLLVTPLPVPGEALISEPYAQAVRDAGRAAELRVVDWHALILAQPQWESLFHVDGDPAVSGRFPNPATWTLLARAIAEGLRR